MLRTFNCHINVEACGSIKSDKYLFKYIYKGRDKASIAIREGDNADSSGNADEIKRYRDRCSVGDTSRSHVEDIWFRPKQKSPTSQTIVAPSPRYAYGVIPSVF